MASFSTAEEEKESSLYRTPIQEQELDTQGRQHGCGHTADKQPRRWPLPPQGKQWPAPTRNQPCLKPFPGVTLTCHVLYPPGGTWRGRPPGERSRLALVWTQSVCSARRCDTAGRSESAARQTRNDCHPKAHGSEKDGLSPERVQRVTRANSSGPSPKTTIIISATMGMLAHICEPALGRLRKDSNLRP